MANPLNPGDIAPGHSHLRLERSQRERLVFVATIFVGSVLLFLVQPMMARMALLLLGGAPAVWNSAMLVYQALLLAGYAYAHMISSLPIRRQAFIHILVLGLAALSLPLALADISPSAQGWEFAWVPLLFLASVGPVFFAVSAQAPLMQSWYAADTNAGAPYWLYAASNLGSFGGLLAYPLLLEPNFPIRSQSLIWSLGFGALAGLVILAALLRWRGQGAGGEAPAQPKPVAEPIGLRRVLFWFALSAVPSGLMLSTTTLLTTDMVAMPLLWVIPLGLYLLSFAFAFNENSAISRVVGSLSPLVVLLGGAFAMGSRASGTMIGAIASIFLLLVVAIALHRKLYNDRPEPTHLTRFYLIMSLGGALGGLFTALVAPIIFDWVWEHAVLVLAAAALLPGQRWMHWAEGINLPAEHRRSTLLVGLLGVILLSYASFQSLLDGAFLVASLTIGVATLLTAFLFESRPLFVAALLALMLGHGGFVTLSGSLSDARERSFFGIYEVSKGDEDTVRRLKHGTTVHGLQFNDPEREFEPTAYYGRTSGIGLALANSAELTGKGARVGVVGLGVGTLACYRQPGQSYEFFEIDPAVLGYSRDGTFTFIEECAPYAPVHIGDAPLVLEGFEPSRFDILVIAALSSDAIPLHLLTQEAFDIYRRQLSDNGVLMIHIANRYVKLAPMISALSQASGMAALHRLDQADAQRQTTASNWVVLSDNPDQLDRLVELSGKVDARGPSWKVLPEPSDHVWNDDFASILPFLRWKNLIALTH